MQLVFMGYIIDCYGSRWRFDVNVGFEQSSNAG